ncbi:hypothetical protein C8Z91_23495 [Paenibacillus elgii]|uniref:Uncharacterized protein n=1 Tax=Paenibacillus elgii TaxID=189691 RepID=A0A2T6FWW4_9BACL|nr:hypothetical protein [Paenibacillus elgii]PUA36382.1 hypothetical protein C8Z91_23495 [Paenibacillus elgii]
MNREVEQALQATLQNWSSMALAEHEDSETAANAFESSFYRFIDAVREWASGLEPQPETIEAFLDLPMVQEMIELLPAPLYLNFETEAELIVQKKFRIEDEKYD